MKAMLNEIDIDAKIAKMLEPILTGFTTPYLTKKRKITSV